PELTKMIKKKKPDVIVSVHPMVNHLTIKAIKDSKLDIPLLVVITDPVTLHRAWIVPGVDVCIVATPEAKERAIKYGMPSEKIRVIGLPIHPKFLKKKAKKKNKLFTVLLMGGGEGMGKMGEIAFELEQAKIKARLIVIAGRNQKLEKKLRQASKSFALQMEIYGFTDKVPEIMAESDIIITKAGPGTIAEALAMNLPLIITDWLPGQEEGNVEFVVSQNIGRVSRDPAKVVDIVREFMVPERFDTLKKNIKRVSRPQASLGIAREIFRYL
ncbi:MAG: glycosyltransferase, partial [Candidatus Margulisbacteria bacterium]|nr:glycosyltransferase [Candidatus Margulisiibacteriota bacterium]